MPDKANRFCATHDFKYTRALKKSYLKCRSQNLPEGGSAGWVGGLRCTVNGLFWPWWSWLLGYYSSNCIQVICVSLSSYAELQREHSVLPISSPLEGEEFLWYRITGTFVSNKTQEVAWLKTEPAFEGGWKSELTASLHLHHLCAPRISSFPHL
jgi:hypothetical protein